MSHTNKVTIRVEGARVEVEYTWHGGDKGDSYTPPCPPSVEIHGGTVLGCDGKPVELPQRVQDELDEMLQTGEEWETAVMEKLCDEWEAV